MRLFSEAKYEFIQRRRGAYVVSGVLVAVGLAAIVVNIFTIGSWQNYGVDFTGGAHIQVDMGQPTSEAEIRAAVGEELSVTPFEGQSVFVIRAPLAVDQDINAIRDQIRGSLDASFGEGSYVADRVGLVGPKIAAELETKAALAVLLSFFLTLLYLAIRFEWRFGFAAVLATVHDLTLTLGFLAAFRVEITLPTIAAILTIVGYSLNDTIVVFDRIRENLGKKGARKEDPIDLVNRSINETLPRTVLTSGTTLAVLLALLLLGPAVIRDFSVVLILGVLIGTYSSIFVASPALIEIQKRFGEGRERKRKRRPQPGTV